MTIEPRIEKLFVCLAAAKHLKFTAAFPTPGAVNVAKMIWQNGLKQLSDAEIAGGINALADWQPEHPEERVPTLTEFKNLLCPRIPISRTRLNDNSEPFALASPETAKKNWQSIATKVDGKLGAAINKILQRYD